MNRSNLSFSSSRLFFTRKGTTFIQILFFLTLLASPVNPAFSQDSGFKIISASLENIEGKWRLKTEMDYRFSPATIEALNNGVPLTIIVELRIMQPRRWLWPKTILRKKHQFTLRYHALAKLYQITDAVNNRRDNFASFQAIKDYLNQPPLMTLDLPLITADNPRYTGKIRSFLKIEALPLPLRPVAYLTPQWHLTSEWYRWSNND